MNKKKIKNYNDSQYWSNENILIRVIEANQHKNRKKIPSI